MFEKYPGQWEMMVEMMDKITMAQIISVISKILSVAII